PARWYVPPALRQVIKTAAREQPKNPTRSENLVWQALRRDWLDVPLRRQQPIGPYIVDFYCPAARLAIEIDGQVHEDQQIADAGRKRNLESLGLQFLRFAAAKVEQDLDSVLERIRPLAQ